MLAMEKTAMQEQKKAIKGLAQAQADIAAKETSLEGAFHDIFAMRRPDGSAQVQPLRLAAPFADAAGATEVPKPSWEIMLVNAIIYVILTVIFAYVYGACFTYAYPPLRFAPVEPDKEHFTFGLLHGFQCDPDWRICFCSCFCSGIRWADTMGSSKVRFMSFWAGVLLFATLTAFASLTGIGALVLVCVGVFGRQRVRQVYELKHGDCESCTQDFLVWLCCSPCAIMQEAAQIEFVVLPKSSSAAGNMVFITPPMKQSMNPV